MFLRALSLHLHLQICWRVVVGQAALSLKPAVLWVGFKRFPACWHLKEFAGLLLSVPADNTVKSSIR